jgi:NitT/TauT family transport system permease protein
VNRERTRRIGGYAVATVVLLAGWAALAAVVQSPALPGPVAALSVFATQLPALMPEVAVSLYRVVTAMVIGTALGVPLGLALGRSPRADAVFAPIVFLTYPIPKVVFLPVLMVLLGLGDASKITLIVLIVFFQILVTARDAAKSVPEASVLSVRSLGATRWQVARHVIVPAALPEVFTALRIGTGTAVAVLFLAESIAGSSGIGYYIVDAWGRIDYPAMFAGIVAMGLLGVALYEALNLIEHRTTRWRTMSN